MDGSKETPQSLFVRVLEIEPKWAAALVDNGFTTLEEVAYVPLDEFRSISEFDEEQIQVWRVRARRHLLVQIVDDRGDEDPLAAATVEPPKPMSGGSGAGTQ
jgi:transcription termination factor NusA